MAILQSTRQRTIYAGDINPLLTCGLCNGYMIKPTCITECLHTFCRSCIVKHLGQKEMNECPTCMILIHETNPMEMLRTDQMLEDVIYKLIPGLQQGTIRITIPGTKVSLDEERREREFIRKMKKMKEEKDVMSDRDSSVNSTADTTYRTTFSYNNYHRDEPQICVCLECSGDSDDVIPVKQLIRRYIRCSSQMTIAHVKKYLKLKLSLTAADQVEILCNGEIMGKDHTLEFVYMTRWRVKEGTVMTLQYRPRIDFL